MNWQTALILFAMISVAVMPVLIVYLGWEGFKMLGKAYRPTIAVLLIVLVILALIYAQAWLTIYTLFLIVVGISFGRFCLRPFS